MSEFAQELAALFARDLTRLAQELRAFPDDATLWRVVPGVTNCAGNLVLHLEGNLREYVGRQLGGVAYTRHRDLEFAAKDVPQADLMRRAEELRDLIPGVIRALSEQQLDGAYPENVFGKPASTRQFLLSLYAHLSYHTGQIDYLRRVLTGGAAVSFAGL